MRTSIIAGFIASLITGCALAPPLQNAQILSQALPEGTTIPVAWKADPGTGEVANDWLKSLNDPQLDAIVAEAIANNLDLRQAAENVRIAQQTLVVVGSQLLPQVNADIGARASQDEDHANTSNATQIYANVAWELDVWGKLRAQRASSQASYEATVFDYANARQSLAATVAKTWYLCIETRQLLALAEQSVSIYSELLSLVTFRNNAGKDSNLNVVEMRANLAFAQSSVEAARMAFAESKRALEVMLGRYPAAEIAVSVNYLELPAPRMTGIPSTLLERRPEILAAERAVIASFYNTQAAKLALLPDFSISLSSGRLTDQLLALLGENPWLTTAAIGMAIPIFEGGTLKAKLEISTAQQAQAVDHYGAVVLTAFREVENALSNEHFLLKRIPFEQLAVSNRTAAVQIATIQYKAGRQDLLWVSNLQNSQISAEAQLIRLRALQRANRIKLMLALGGGFDAIPSRVAGQ